MARFTHLHTHSHYSLLDGLGTVPGLINRAKELGMESLALTDHGVLYGAVEFAKTAKKAGIKPIIGCELYVAPRAMTDRVNRIDTTPYHLVVLCKDKTGYQNLLKLVSAAHLEGYYYKPRVDKDLLKKHSEGLIAMTACLAGEVNRAASENDIVGAEKAIKSYLDIFGPDRLFLELQHHPEIARQETSNKVLIDLAKKLSLPLIATNDIHYLNYEDAEAQDALLCIQTGRLMDEQDRMSMKENGQYIDIAMTAPEEMEKRFAHVPEAISNSQIIVDQCNFEMELGKFIFPPFPLPEGQTPDVYLKDECVRGLWTKVAKYETAKSESIYPPEAPPKYIERLEYELSIIAKTGFASYMLMVADYTNEAHRRGIFTNTRGSAAGSLVAYLINITNVDPMPYGLFFERFLNPERISWPDVDLDIADVRRGELIGYVTEKYGADKVAQIITFGTIASKNAIRDVGRVLGMPYASVDEVSKLIPLGMSLNDSLASVPALKSRYDSEPEITRLIDLAKKVEGVARHASVHAAGVVISDLALTEYVPLQKVKEESGIVTQYTMYDLEAVGLVKMDFLGLANLTIIERALDIIKATRQVEINTTALPLDDLDTYGLLSRGESSGVFQLESDGMKRYLKELKPTEIGDIIAMVALYRPGPIELIPDYIGGKHGTKTVKYMHPKLEPILKETYGIAVYQEQILQIARELCGFSYGEADILRKAIGKKNKDLLMEQRKKWIDKAVENNITQSLAEKLFDFVEPFARYGFNKAHATSYGMIAYQTAYLKAHFPSQFMAAWLTSEQSRDIEKVSFALKECERMGIEVLPPDVNESFADFGVVPNEEQKNEPIRFGLGAIKNVGHGVAEMIVKERKKNGTFATLVEFIKRMDGKVINRKTIESLAQAGALDRFADRASLLLGIEALLKYSQMVHQDNNGQMGLFGEGDESEELAPLTLPKTAPATKQQKLQWEKELLGIYLSEHPLAEYQRLISGAATSIGDIKQEDVGKTVRVMGIITESKSIITKSKQPMVFAKFEDTGGKTEAIVFPTVLAENPSLWAVDKVLLIDGKINDKDGSLKILVDKAYDITGKSSLEEMSIPPLTERANGNGRRGGNGGQYPSRPENGGSYGIKKASSAPLDTNVVLNIKLPTGCVKSLLADIKKAISTHPGSQSVVLLVPQNSHFDKLPISNKVDANPVLLHKLKEIVGNENVILENA